MIHLAPYSCTLAMGVCGHAPMRKFRKIKQYLVRFGVYFVLKYFQTLPF